MKARIPLVQPKKGKKKTSPLRIKDADLDEGTVFPFVIPSWDSHGVNLH